MSDGGRPSGGVGGVATDAIRGMILRGELLPSQKLHQAELAERLGLSRIPVREALSTLVAEGLVEHRSNTGYTVVRPTAEALHQIYLMRRLLETEVLRSIDLAGVDVAALEAANDRLAELDPGVSMEEYRAVNQEFHFLIFESSPLALVVREVRRMWTLSEFYRSLYMHEPGAPERVLHDHAEMIEAVRAGDLEALVALSDQHRDGTEISLSRVLGAVGSLSARGR